MFIPQKVPSYQRLPQREQILIREEYQFVEI